jgi:hypothetical protein
MKRQHLRVVPAGGKSVEPQSVDKPAGWGEFFDLTNWRPAPAQEVILPAALVHQLIDVMDQLLIATRESGCPRPVSTRWTPTTTE